MRLLSFKSLQFGIHEKGTVSADFLKKGGLFLEIVNRKRREFATLLFKRPMHTSLSPISSLPSFLSFLCLSHLLSSPTSSLPSSPSSLLFFFSPSFLFFSFSSSLLLLVSFSYLSSFIFPLLFPTSFSSHLFVVSFASSLSPSLIFLLLVSAPPPTQFLPVSYVP
jgi:hypothetical protein